MPKTKKLIKTISALTLCLMMAPYFTLITVAQTVNESFKSDQKLQPGMLVGLVEGDSRKVEKTAPDSLERLKGVVVAANDSPVRLSAEGEEVFVATGGVYDVLVSDENGEIKQGDYLSISSLAGVAAKAGAQQSVVIGRANQEFNASSTLAGTYNDPRSGRQINFGRIEIAVSIVKNPVQKQDDGNRVPELLENISVSIAGKPVSTTRMWLALALFLGTALIVGAMLYSGARSSMLSIGRNPLSRKPIARGLLQVILLGLIVFISGMFGVYLVLKI